MPFSFDFGGFDPSAFGGFSAYSFASHDFNLSGKGYMDDASCGKKTTRFRNLITDC